MNVSVVGLIQQRLRRVAALVPVLESTNVGVVAWFQREMAGPLKDLQLTDRSSRVGGSGRVDIVGTNGDGGATLALSDEMLSLLGNYFAQSPEANPAAVIDNFLIHEIVHRAQGMGDGRHRGLGSNTPEILALCDYEADASAVLIQTFLDCASIGTTFLDEATRLQAWRFYRENIRSVLGQIGIFSLMSETGRPLTNEQSLAIPIGLRRWERMAAWHFQDHRANSFHCTRSPLDMQILFPPRLTSRIAMAAAEQGKLHHQGITRVQHGHAADAANTDGRSDLTVAFSNRWGVREVHRLTTYAHDHWISLMDGIFERDPAKSAVFFRSQPVLMDVAEPETTSKQQRFYSSVALGPTAPGIVTRDPSI